MATVELNGVDLSTYGFTAQIADDLLSSPARSYDAVKQPDRPGARVGLRTIASKPFTVAGMLESTSLAAARSNLDLLMDVALRAQPSTVVFHWSTSRRLSAECLGVQWAALGSPVGFFKYDVRLLFDAADPPFWMGTTQHSVTSIQSTGASLPAGNAPIRLQVLVAGPTSDIELKLQNSTGAQVGAIKFTGINLAGSTSYLAVDMDARTAYTNVTCTFTNA